MIIGVDPGGSGAITYPNNGTLESMNMGKNIHEIRDQIYKLGTSCGFGEVKKAYLEKVHSMPHQGVSSTFKFGKNYGNIEMALACHGFQIVDVTPQKWMKTLGVGSRKDHDGVTAWKRHLLSHARRLYPSMEITLQKADSVLIAHYGLLQEKDIR